MRDDPVLVWFAWLMAAFGVPLVLFFAAAFLGVCLPQLLIFGPLVGMAVGFAHFLVACKRIYG